jgi:hypothetical protein
LDKHLNRKRHAPKTDHLLLTETDNPGALKWLNKNDEIGMPTAIQNVVDKVAELRQSTPERIEKLIHADFCGLLAIISRFMSEGLSGFFFRPLEQANNSRN